jgi:hypothetical protein
MKIRQLTLQNLKQVPNPEGYVENTTNADVQVADGPCSVALACEDRQYVNTQQHTQILYLPLSV